MKLKILYLTQHPEIGGGETILLSLLEKLDRNRFSPHVVVPQEGTLTKELESLKVPVSILPLPGYLIRTLFVPGMSPLGIYRFLKLAKMIKPDLIHLNHLNLAVYTGVARMLLKIPVVATAHGPWDTLYFYQDLITHFCVDLLLPNTADLAKKLLRSNINPSHKIRFLPFGIDTEKFKPRPKEAAKKRLGMKHSDVLITNVGRFDPKNNHLSFLRAANLINRQLPETKILIVGSSLGNFSDRTNTNSPERNINGYLKNHPKLRSNVIMTGFVNEMERIYAATDILVSTSLLETFGLALAEAQASGIPVVTTNAGSQSLIVKDGQTGFLVPPRQPKATADKILILAKDPKLRQQFGKYSREYILAHFTITRYVNTIESIYQQMIRKKNQDFRK